MQNSNLVRCEATGKDFPSSEVVHGRVLRDSVLEMIKAYYPDFTRDSYISLQELNRIRLKKVEELMREETGELSPLQQEVLESIEKHELLSKDMDTEIEERLSLGDRMADRIASFGGSWGFILSFFAILIVWIVINTIALFGKPYDPFPFILLNLVLSCLAAIQAPIIMMSQNRQEEKDRQRGQHDYQVNLKAELEVRLLNEKVDRLMTGQWHQLIEIQRMQMEMLQDLARVNSSEDEDEEDAE